nr:Toll/interleukin-1 receptor (TIR) domain-containing protein [Tanacetum cinerariifolium]
EAIYLFRRCAFGREKPLQGYEKLSGKVVRYAAGLPLMVRVLGSFLCGKDKVEWRSLITISKHEVLGMHDHIEERVRVIVRRSHPDEPNKHSRLWIKEEIKDILANDMGTEATRCLRLDMSKGNSRILMKGLRKMKKLRYLEVYFAAYGHWESDGERLGSDPKFDDTKETRCVKLNTWREKMGIVMKGFTKMKKLRYLVRDLDSQSDEACLGSDLKFDEATQDFTNSLKYLKCTHYPFLYLPKTFEANNLVGLEMGASRMLQLWEEGEEK